MTKFMSAAAGEKGRKKAGGLDAFRLAAAFLVVAIHTSPLSSFSPSADFFLTRILARIAVPFFFMVTGQFVLGKAFDKEEGGDEKLRDWKARLKAAKNPGLWKSVRKMALLYGFCVLLYLPVGIYAGHYEALGLWTGLRMIFFDGTFYHLWYFPACILGLILVWLGGIFFSGKAVAVLAAILYGIGLMGDSYYGLLEGAPGIKAVYDAGFQVFSYTRNGIFFAPVFLAMGAYLGKKNRKTSRRAGFFAIGSAISLGLMTAEGFLLRYFALQRHDSMYLFLLPCMYFLYQWISCWQIAPLKKCRTLSMWIYILHPGMIVAVRGVGKVLQLTELLVDNSLVHYLAVSAASLAGAAAMTGAVSLAAAIFWPASETAGFWKLQRKACQEPYQKDDWGRAWIELDRSALAENVRLLTAELPGGCRLMPAIKADAYGHGAVLVAEELNRLGVHDFCVASAGEGMELRRAGIKGNILVLGYTCPRDFHLLQKYDLIQTAVDYAYACLLNQAGERMGKFRVHLAVDTGMHRLGISSEAFDELCDIFSMKYLKTEGIFTHLCAADTLRSQDVAYTKMQAERFYEVVTKLKKTGNSCPKIHLSSSYGLLNYPEFTGDYARVGIALYGVFSTKEDTENSRLPLKPVLSLKARVASVKKLQPGEKAGYGLSFTAYRETAVAVLSIGYGDGLPRALSCGTGEVLIGGGRVRIIGRICMDQTLVDVTHIPNVTPGDIAVLIGSSGEETISVCDIAEQAGTITNEILSRLGKRLERGIV